MFATKVKKFRVKVAYIENALVLGGRFVLEEPVTGYGCVFPTCNKDFITILSEANISGDFVDIEGRFVDGSVFDDSIAFDVKSVVKVEEEAEE